MDSSILKFGRISIGVEIVKNRVFVAPKIEQKGFDRATVTDDELASLDLAAAVSVCHDSSKQPQ